MRNGCTPFLPDTNIEGAQRMANGVVINYQEAKQIFLQILAEEPGVQVDAFQGLDGVCGEWVEEGQAGERNKIGGV